MYSEVSGGLSYSQTAKPWHFNEDVDEHHLLKEAYAFLFGSPEAFLQNEKWRYLLRNMFSKPLTFAIVADKNILANTHIDPGQVGQKIPLLTTRVETLAADKHVFLNYQIDAFGSWHLHESEIQVHQRRVTRGFSFSPLRDLCNRRFAALSQLSHAVEYQEKPLGPG